MNSGAILLFGALLAICSYKVTNALRTGDIYGRRGVRLNRYARPQAFWLNVGSFIVLGAMAFGMIAVTLVNMRTGR